MFEDDEPVAGGKPAFADKDEIESSTSKPPASANLRSRALSTQYKLDQLEKQRELAAKKKAQRQGSGLLQKTGSTGTGDEVEGWAGPAGSGGGTGGLRMLEGSSDDDEDDDDRLKSANFAQVQNAAVQNDRGSTVSSLLSPNMALSPGKKAAMSNAEKKLSMLGLSTEVDQTKPKNASAKRPETTKSSGKATGAFLGDDDDDDDDAEGDDLPVAQEPTSRATEEEEDDDLDPLDLDSGILNDIRSFVLVTIPKSQPTPVQCYIKRVRSGFQKLWPYYTLYVQDPDKFLLAGRRRKKNKQSMYLISTDEKDMSKKSDAYAGKVKSNFVGTEFTMYDSGGNPSKKDGGEIRTELGVVQYDRNVLGTNGPRRMQCWVPRTANGVREKLQPTTVATTMSSQIAAALKEEDTEEVQKTFMKLVNKTPRWNESLGAFCLNFQGRVTVASVKNFQLVDEASQDRVILQFGKCSDDTFTMDYAYPLCALQAFAICLTSFDHKLACE